MIPPGEDTKKFARLVMGSWKKMRYSDTSPPILQDLSRHFSMSSVDYKLKRAASI
jgi:hypothetical protein